MIPVSIRRWFLAHFAFNVLIGAPLLVIPKTFLGAMGWITIDPASARFCGAALLAVGVQSLLTCNEGHHALRTMLNFKMLWSWAAIAGLVFAAAEGAPNAVWAFLAFFVAMSGVWFQLRVQLAEYMDHGAPMADEMPIFPLSPQLQGSATAHDVDEVSDQFFVDEAAVSPAARLPRVVLKPKDPGPDLLGDAPIDDRSAGSLIGRLKPGAAAKAAASAAESAAEEESDSGEMPAADPDDPDALGADDIAAMFAKSSDPPAEEPAPESAALAETAEEPEVDQADAEVPDAPAEVSADEAIAPPPAETGDAEEAAAITTEPVTLEASEPAALEASEPAALEASESVAVTSEPIAETNEPALDISEEEFESNAPNAGAAPPADEMAPEVVVAAAEKEAINDDALAAAAPAAVEVAESPPAILADEITNETSVEQIEQVLPLESPASSAAAPPVEPAVKPSAPPVAAAEEIRKAINSVLRPKTGKQSAPPAPPPAKTLNGLPVLRLDEKPVAANAEPADTTDDEELGMDAIAAMLAANRG